MQAHTESVYDDYERMATQAMMMRSAYHAKKLKQADLFKRPSDSERSTEGLRELKEKTAEMNEWLAGVTTARKEDD